jgi:hypothetical protein
MAFSFVIDRCFFGAATEPGRRGKSRRDKQRKKYYAHMLSKVFDLEQNVVN